MTPDKVYGPYSGKDLITMYRTQPVKQKPVSSPVLIHENDIILRLSTGPLPDTIKVYDKVYKTRDFISAIEKATGLRILSKRYNKALKHMQNTSLKLPIALLSPFLVIR